MPVVHEITRLYKTLYIIGKKVPKRDRFGIQADIEKICRIGLELAIEAAFSAKPEKHRPLRALQIKIEILKRFIRLTRDSNIYTEESYIDLEKNLQEISKMIAGWLKYVTHKEP